MQITLNNKIDNITGKTELTIQELILLKNYTFHMLVTKINGKLVKKEDRPKAIIKDGDNVMVMHLISGG